MIKQDLFLIEPLSIGEEHININSMLLSSILKQKDNYRNIHFIGEKKHCSILRKKFKNKITFIDALKRRNSRFFNFLFALQLVCLSVLKPSKIIFLSSNKNTIRLNAFLYSKNKITSIIHSYFSEFLQDIKLSENSLFKKSLDRTVFFVFREDILKHVKKINQNININFIEHPIEKKFEFQDKKQIKNIAFLGRPSKEKGFDKYLDFIKKIRSDIRWNGIKFYHIGPMEEVQKNDITKGYLDPLSNLCENFKAEDNQFINNDDFDVMLKKIDCVFYCNENCDYQYIASGTIFDAISYGKKIIGLKDSFVKDIESRHRSIGIFAENIEDLAKTLVHYKFNFEPEYIENKVNDIFSSEYQSSIKRFLDK